MLAATVRVETWIKPGAAFDPLPVLHDVQYTWQNLTKVRNSTRAYGFRSSSVQARNQQAIGTCGMGQVMLRRRRRRSRPCRQAAFRTVPP